MNIVSLLRCPVSGGELTLDETRAKLISPSAKVYYAINNNIPILVKTEAVPL